MKQIQKTILNGEIATLMETIREQFETLNSFEGKIPILEFEIIKDNVRKLYENLCLLQRMNDPFDLIRQREQEIIEEVNEPSEVEVESVKIDVPAFETPFQIIEGAYEPKETEAESLKIDISSSVTAEQTFTEKDESSETTRDPVKVDLFTSETTAFNDKLKEAREQTLGPRFRQSTPGDIKSIININDKFLFINELFDGDYKEYTHTIEIFNNFDEKSEAFEFLDSLLKNNLWNSTSPAFLKLKEIIEKKFI